MTRPNSRTKGERARRSSAGSVFSTDELLGIFDAMQDGYFRVDVDGRIVSANPSGARLYGFGSPAEMIGQESGWIWVVPSERSEAVTLLDTVGTMTDFIAQARRKDGSIFWASLSGRALRSGGRRTGAEVFVRDISTRKQAEEALRRSEDKFAQAFRGAAGASAIATIPEAILIDVNDGFLQLTGYVREEVLGKTVGDLSLWVLPQQRELVVRQLSAGGIVTGMEVLFRRKSREIAYGLLSAATIEVEGTPCILTQTVDITERKIAEQALEEREQALRENEARARAMLEAIPDMVFRMDRHATFVDYKAAIDERSGDGDLIGRRNRDLVPPELATLIDETIGKTLETRQLQTFEYERATPGLGRRAYEGRMVASGPDEVTAIVRDVTERKNAEIERERLELQLRQSQKIETVGRLAGGVAHDFNNMLGVILGHAELALAELDPSHPVREDLLAIKTSARHSADLTRQLLGFARRQTVLPKVLNLNDSIEVSLAMLRRLIGEDVDLAWRPCPRPAWVKIDPAQIDQILSNLCVNARDAIGGVGRVTIATEIVVYDAEHRGSEPDAAPGDYVRLTVADTGSGMDADTQAHLFEPFFTTKSVGKGTGLGLATVYGIVKQNQGHVGVWSEPGKGTRFTIDLPRHVVEATRAESAGGPAAGRKGHESLLVVEDEPALLKLVSKLLSSCGYRVMAARTPSEAIELAGRPDARIDLLVTDVIMPEMNGRELAARIQVLHPDARRIFTSGYTADVLAVHGVQDDDVHFIQKPYSPDALLAKVRGVLDRSR